MHLAFLRAHNRLLEEVSSPEKFRKAKRRLRRHYQHVVIHDFLNQIADEGLTVALDGVPLGGKVRRDGPPR
jgi:hypothetical protein